MKTAIVLGPVIILTAAPEWGRGRRTAIVLGPVIILTAAPEGGPFLSLIQRV